MDKPWYQNLFVHSRKPTGVSTKAKADAGDAEAQFNLGLKCAGREGIAPDYQQAEQWYAKAAEQGHSRAQLNLGLMYSTGQGRAKDEATANGWFYKAALQGEAGALFNLGISHYRASLNGSTPNALESRTEAYKWFCLADAQGYQDPVSMLDCLNLRMSHEELADATRRAADFVRSKNGSVQKNWVPEK